MTREKKDTTIVILGLGPTGLAAAIEAVKHANEHTKVVLISNRATYDRHPIFRINEATYQYLKDLVGREVMAAQFQQGFFNMIPPQRDVYYHERYYQVKINRVEIMLLEKLNQFEGQFELIQINPSSNVQIHARDRTIYLDNGRVLSFTYVIAADGVHHHYANQLMQQGVSLAYHNRQQRQIHSFHTIGCYHIPNQRDMRQYRRMLNSPQENENKIASVFEEIKQAGWQLNSFPESRIFMVENTLYVGSEAPKEGLLTQSERDRWLRNVLRGTLPDEEVAQLTVKGITNGRNPFGVFDITLEEANQVVVPLKSPTGKMSYFIQMGDALRSPHYQTGSGVVIGLLQAKAWGEFLSSGQKSQALTHFQATVDNLLTHNRKRVDIYLSGRKDRELAARKNPRDSLVTSSALFFANRTEQALEDEENGHRAKRRRV